MDIDIIYQEAVNNEIQYHSEQMGRMEELGDRKPEWSEPRKLFKKKRGKTRFKPCGVPTGTIGVYRIIYEPTGETMSIGCGIIPNRIGRHRDVFLNKGKFLSHNNSSSNSQTAFYMYQHDTHRKNWTFSWCNIENKSLAKKYEDLLIKNEKPLFNNESMGGK